MASNIISHPDQRYTVFVLSNDEDMDTVGLCRKIDGLIAPTTYDPVSAGRA